MENKKSQEYLRNFIFGVEDSLVSTVGLVSGVAAAGMSKQNILLAGIILVFVEAFSMAIGSILSETSVGEYTSKKEQRLRESLGGSVVMFFSYLVSGFIVVLPYVFTTPTNALMWSVMVSLIGLFGLGMTSAHLSKTSLFRKGIIMAGLGGLAILLGVAVGRVVKSF